MNAFSAGKREIRNAAASAPRITISVSRVTSGHVGTQRVGRPRKARPGARALGHRGIEAPGFHVTERARLADQFHRRGDKGAGALPEEPKEDEPIHARSVSLSSVRLTESFSEASMPRPH